jgi:hypothetical protein
MTYQDWLAHFNPNHDPKTGQFASSHGNSIAVPKGSPKNVVSRNDIKSLMKYKMNIIGEIHNRDMIGYYDKLLGKKKPEYFICEFADMDRCYDRKQLKDRMDHATNGSFESDGKGADYQYNYWAYELAYKHNCKLIGCNPVYKKPFDRMHDEDAFREKYMLDVLKEFEGKNAVVQLGDHHLRSIPIDKGFLNYTGDTTDDRGIVSDLSVDNASPVWEYFKNKSDVSISREPDEYNAELRYKNIAHQDWLAHFNPNHDPKTGQFARKSVFVSGSSKTQDPESVYYRKELPQAIKDRLNEFMKMKYTVVVGDAPGIDRQVQDYLNSGKYPYVEVYGPGKKVRYVSNKYWNTHPIDAPEFEEGSKEWLAKKDIEMERVSDVGLAVILDEGAKATRKNVERLIQNNKDVSVYELSKLGIDFDKWVK